MTLLINEAGDRFVALEDYEVFSMSAKISRRNSGGIKILAAKKNDLGTVSLFLRER